MRSKTITIVLLGGVAVLFALYLTVKGAVFSRDSIPEKAEQVKPYIYDFQIEPSGQSYVNAKDDRRADIPVIQ